MKYSLDDLVKYRIERAEECIEEAKLLAKEEHWNTVANRLYYAGFYIVNALLVKRNLRAISHSGIKSEFHKHFIKTGIVDKQYGKLYSDLFDKRHEGDYQAFKRYSSEEINPLINEMKNFVIKIKTVIQGDDDG